MIARKLSVTAVAAALCVSGLSACRSNVGQAATVDGHRISESDIAQYFTQNAQPVPLQDANGNVTGSTPPRSFVLGVLINTQLYVEALSKQEAGGVPSDGDIAAAETTLLQGTTVDAVTTQYASHGFKKKFVTLYLRENALQQILGTRIQGGSIDANKVLKDIGSGVSVNPRYGKWDAKNFVLSSGPSDGLPSFLKLGTPTPVVASSTPATN